MYPTNANSLLCKTRHRFANMFRSRGIIIISEICEKIRLFHVTWYIVFFHTVMSTVVPEKLIVAHVVLSSVCGMIWRFLAVFGNRMNQVRAYT